MQTKEYSGVNVDKIKYVAPGKNSNLFKREYDFCNCSGKVIFLGNSLARILFVRKGTYEKCYIRSQRTGLTDVKEIGLQPLLNSC